MNGRGPSAPRDDVFASSPSKDSEKEDRQLDIGYNRSILEKDSLAEILEELKRLMIL